MDLFRKISRLAVKVPKPFWWGFLIGSLYYAYTFSWFWSLYPLTALGISSKAASFLLILLAFSLSAACMGFFWGLMVWAAGRIVPKTSPLMAPFALASLFVLTQYAQAWGFGIFWWGDGALLGPHWTLGNPAYFFNHVPAVLKTASIWGIYGIDFLLALLVSAIGLRIWDRRYKKSLWLALITVLMAFGAGVYISSDVFSQNKKISVSLIQTKNPVKDSYAPAEILDDLSKKNELLKQGAKNSDVVIFPERAWFSQTTSQFLDPSSLERYFNGLSAGSVLVVDNNRILENGSFKSRVMFIDSKNGLEGIYDKRLLTPGGEFVPYLMKGIISLFSPSRLSSHIEFAEGATDNTFVRREENIEVLVCSDVISPAISRTRGSGYIIGLNSLGIFGENERIAEQFLAMARFRASENRKYLAMASNYGLSYIIDPHGKVQEKTGFSGYQILTGDIAPNGAVTWYNKLGDWPILTLSFVLVILGIISSQCQKKSASSSLS